MKKWIFIGVGSLLLVVATVGGTLFMSGAFNDSANDPAAMSPEVGAAVAENAPIFYHNVQPEFVINFNRKERPRALMVEISISSHDEKALDTLDSHSPELRNNLLLLMTENNGSTLSTADGKNALRESVKIALNDLLVKHGKSEAVEDIFFTRFVLQ